METEATTGRAVNVFDTARALFGKPCYETQGCVIYNLECLEAMGKLAERLPCCVDLTATSPPYNIGKEYEARQPVQQYLDWCEAWINAIYALTKARWSFLA